MSDSPTESIHEPVAASAAGSGSVERRCQNCGSALLGDHCYACGQPVKGLVRHFSSIMGDFFDSVFDLDSRLLRTLGPLILKPGQLSIEYFAGHRVRHVSPVRLFVFLCITAFLAVQWLTEPDVSLGGQDIKSALTVEEVESSRDALIANMQEMLQEIGEGKPGAAGVQAGIATVEKQAAERIEWLRMRDAEIAAGRPPPRDPAEEQAEIRFGTEPWDREKNPVRLDWLSDAGNERLNDWVARAQDNVARVRKEPGLLSEAFLQSLPQTLFVLVPMFALLLKVAYLFRRRLYMEHLIVALHSHAFLCVAVLLLVLLGQGEALAGEGSTLAGAIGWLELAVGLWMPLYLWIAQKRVYGQGVLMTSLKFVVLGVCYTILLTLGALMNLVFALVAL